MDSGAVSISFSFREWEDLRVGGWRDEEISVGGCCVLGRAVGEGMQ